MKLNSWLFLTAALCSPSLNAQVSLPAVPTSPVSVDAGPHHRTWQTVKVQLDERGKQVAVTNSYVELATGMNVWSETEWKWVAANDEIALVDGGAIAARTQHKVVFLPNLNDRQPPISMFLPDGKPLRSQIVGLAYTERDTGPSVFISELKDSVGQVVGRNQVIYPDAFESIKAFGYSGWNDHYPGLLDEVRIYNRALSAAEIAGLASLRNGIPWDTDGDGIADYLEDRNGNGVTDTGETNWQDQNDLGLKVLITRPNPGGPLP